MVDWSRLYHTGVRVPVLEAAMEEMGSSLGLRWCTPRTSEHSVWIPDGGVVEIPLRFTYSTTGPVHLELLEGAPGSIWDGRDSPGIHHVGVWSDDVRADTEAMIDEGWRLLMSQTSPADGYGAFTYVQPPSGLVVEFVWSAIAPMFERWFAGGSLT